VDKSCAVALREVNCITVVPSQKIVYSYSNIAKVVKY